MKMKLVLLLICAASSAFAQTHFTFTANTGLTGTVAVQASIAPTIAGASIAVGDEIGVFTPAGLCVGAVVWQGISTAITVWPDNSITPAVDGIAVGETISYRVWQKSTNIEFSNVIVTYSQGDGKFVYNALFVLASLTAINPPPAAPVLLSPANGVTNVATTPTLQWQASANATSYNIEVSTSPSFAANIVQTNLGATSYPMPTLTEGVKYYWHVQATNGTSVGAWSTPFSFTVTITPPPLPGIPTLTQPVTGQLNVSTTPTLQWLAASNAATYTVVIATDFDFTSIVSNQTGVTGVSTTTPMLAEGSLYFWRVQSVNTTGASGWSPVFHFTTLVGPPPPVPVAPTLVLPADAAINVSVTPLLQWQAAANAASYNLVVASDTAFKSPVLQTQELTTSKAVSALLTASTYYWRVQGVNSKSVAGPWSPAYRFTTLVSVALDPPALMQPANGAANVPSASVLQWQSVTNAVSYIVLLASDSLFTSNLRQLSAVTASTNIPALTAGVFYYWRVQGVTAKGEAGAWSTVFKFSILSLAPPIPTLVQPANGSVDVPPVVTLQWKRCAGASQYLFQVAADSLFKELIEIAIIADTSKTLDPLKNGSTYYWRVYSEDAAGHTDYFSAPFHFTITTVLSAGPVVSQSPGLFTLEQNYPNPFNPSTTIRFALPSAQTVRVAVYDVLGREVAELVHGMRGAGEHAVTWNAAGMQSGMYVYRVTAGTVTASRTMLLTK